MYLALVLILFVIFKHDFKGLMLLTSLVVTKFFFLFLEFEF